MTELLPDGISYESPDGDVLPADLYDFYAIDESTPEAIEDLVISPEAPLRTQGFGQAEGIIEAGIAKSREGGYANVKVEVWVSDPKDPHGGYRSHISLGQFLAGNTLYSMVSKDEYKELVEKYASIANGGHFAEATTTPITSVETQAHKIGNNAVARFGKHEYRDISSARAGDRLDDD